MMQLYRKTVKVVWFVAGYAMFAVRWLPGDAAGIAMGLTSWVVCSWLATWLCGWLMARCLAAYMASC